nr:mycofactocin-coupled SDR family oxidoreductase [Rhodococcus sp. (in: high G+C Gram-positive bacteria)]
MNRVAGKVAFITGAARGQGRSHAIKLAEEGADIIAVDACSDVSTVPYSESTDQDMAETIKAVESLDRRILFRKADVRDLAALQAVADEGLAEFGQIDIVIANAGVASFGSALDLEEDTWQDMIDINLTGVWKTIKAAVPSMIERGQGGSIILTSSVAGLVAFPNLAHYVAAKHGVTGLMKALSIELAPHRIRANSIHPGNVDTYMTTNEATLKVFTGGASTNRDEAAKIVAGMNALPLPWVDPIDITNAVMYLASDDGRYVTGTTTVIDAGASAPYKIPHS